jgi:hypothetical protein
MAMRSDRVDLFRGFSNICRFGACPKSCFVLKDEGYLSQYGISHTKGTGALALAGVQVSYLQSKYPVVLQSAHYSSSVSVLADISKADSSFAIFS